MAAVQRRMQAAKCDSFLLIQTGHKFGFIKKAVKKVAKVVKKVAKKAVKFVGKAICAGLRLTYNIAKIPVDLATTALNEVGNMLQEVRQKERMRMDNHALLLVYSGLLMFFY